MLPGGSFRPCLMGVLPAVVPGGPVGPDGTLNKVLEPLEHSVLDHTDPPDRHVFAQEVLEPLEHSVINAAGPAGWPVAVGPVGPLRTLFPSDCHPAAPYVAGGPVGPDLRLEKVLEPLEHSVLDHTDPAGQHAFIHEVLGTLACCCWPHLTVALLARLARMLQGALLAQMER